MQPLRTLQILFAPALLSALLFSLTLTTHAETIHFDDIKPGKLPPHWLGTETGIGSAKWSVEKDDTAPSPHQVLKQSGEAEFPICIKQDTDIKNGFVEVKFKLVGGKEDQAGGVIWRCKDKDNYYVARANAKEDSVVIFHTIRGKREEFKTADVKVLPDKWHTLRVDFQDNRFLVSFNGQQVINVQDDSIKDSGKVGVWTKSDSVTLFDDFSFSSAQ
ncbi:family 16 glycoside hydrolase [Pedosphaera parvula]|uniref:3-keto-alpha-glucoside-1,2-lyase/3-keto-2-hydroxy-glucal hydratase domain-containing protein n=1 Tax=Pedosphaera parvula (strain Ellin514) TaxID=320771 RepID=B9XCN9_PEDPL|nr:family 16 glycoside hydrolase [Pedosphaera parvula]EEF62235.1 conserved hypothetical protein [Pedosphaera parvula Ellin514]